jgi:hypothetical protein
VRHCYICNKSGVPISDALCNECKKKIRMEGVPEYLWALIIVIFMSVVAVYWPEVSG